MEIFKTVNEMHAWSLTQRNKGKTISFVPTMGALHEGHLSLLREGRRRADKLVLSIYVNPTQFGPNEDLSKYPRDIEGDLKRALDEKTNAVFLPSDEMMYPKGYETYVSVEKLDKHLCGLSRPGHFRGVTTVVLKLFNIVMPNIAIFGQKDFQQLAIIRRMTTDLNLPIEIIGMPIVREIDGLAMSSRNRYLSTEERIKAQSISKAISSAQEMIDGKNSNIDDILKLVEKTLTDAEVSSIDYIKICNPDTLEDLQTLTLPALLAIAAFVGKTRLIDNCILKT